jgi:transposase InsO family protein
MVDQRKMLVSLSQAPGANLSELAARFGVSRKTLYKWRARAQAAPDLEGLWAVDHSRRPQSCPWRIGAHVEEKICAIRRDNPAWGPRKIRQILQSEGLAELPSASTISAALKRLGLVEVEESLKRQAFVRFERSQPNELWQMDFKGHFRVGTGRCHPLTLVDDHSRFALGVQALGGETGELTRPALIEIFRRYGLPQCMLLDNGSCWGRVEASYTAFTAWLLRLGIRVSYARPFHPQTRGKNERFNRTLKAEAIQGRHFNSLEEWQRNFDRFLISYNTVRPHEALGMQVPASRYTLSSRSYPESLEPIEYLSGDVIRRVGPAGYLSWEKERYHVGRAFSGQPVAMRATNIDGVYEVYFVYQRIAVVDRKNASCRQT